MLWIYDLNPPILFWQSLRGMGNITQISDMTLTSDIEMKFKVNVHFCQWVPMHEVQIQRTNARGENIIFCSKVVYKVETLIKNLSVCVGFRNFSDGVKITVLNLTSNLETWFKITVQKLTMNSQWAILESHQAKGKINKKTDRQTDHYYKGSFGADL